MRLLTVLGILVVIGTLHSQQRHSNERSRDQFALVANVQLTLGQKVGQLLQIRIYGDYKDLNDPAYIYVRDQIRQYHIGSVDLAGRMKGPNLVKASPVQVAKILNELQEESELPLLVGSDIERGLASRLSDVPEFPFPMAFGAISDLQATERFGAITAEQARAVGIHWATRRVSARGTAGTERSVRRGRATIR